jgi:hypothetical protein
MGRKSVHVTYRKNEGQWFVTSGSNGQASGKYGTQKEAMKEGRKQAMEAAAEFVVHGKDGKIRLSTSYGNDPRNSKRSRSSSSSSSRRSKKSK